MRNSDPRTSFGTRTTPAARRLILVLAVLLSAIVAQAQEGLRTPAANDHVATRSEEGRPGKGGVLWSRYRWSQYH